MKYDLAEPRNQTFHWQQPDSVKNMERNKDKRNRKRVQFNDVEKKIQKNYERVIARRDR